MQILLRVLAYAINLHAHLVSQILIALIVVVIVLTLETMTVQQINHRLMVNVNAIVLFLVVAQDFSLLIANAFRVLTVATDVKLEMQTVVVLVVAIVVK